MKTMTLFSAAAIMAAGLPCAASAAATARATTPLNIHSGPGPQSAVIGVIPGNGRATVQDCIRGSGWCQVSYRGIRGWAYSTYLTATTPRGSIELAQNRARLGIPTITYQTPVTATVGVAPVTEAVGAAPPQVDVNPPKVVDTYVVRHPVEPVDLNRDVVVGSVIPQNVELYPVPNYQYEYAYVNTMPVLVAPSTRRIIYVYR